MIYGKGYPIVKATDGSFEFELLYTGIFPVYENNKILENTSPINGERDYVNLWNHVDFKLRVYLFNHDDSADFFKLISNIQDTKFYFKPHKFENDGITPINYIKDENNDLMEFKCVRFNPFYLNDTNKFDIIEIEIEGTKPGKVEIPFPCGMPSVRNEEMNNLLSSTDGTPIVVTAINTSTNTITLSWLPYILSVISPASGKEWALLNRENITPADPALTGDYTEIFRITSGNYATKTLNYSSVLGSEANWNIGDKVMLYNPFEAKWNWRTDPVIEESGSGWREIYVAPSGIFQKKDGTYILLVTGKSATSVKSVGAFSSTDLINWSVLNSDLPIFQAGAKAWCSTSISMYQVNKLVDEDRYIAYLAGNNGSKYNIGWVKFDENFGNIVWSDTEIVDSSAYADGFTASRVIKYDGIYKMICVGRSADLSTTAWKAVEHTCTTQDGTFTNPIIVITGLSTNDGIFNSSHTDMFCYFKHNKKLYCILGGTARYKYSGYRGNRVYGLMYWDKNKSIPAWVLDSRSPIYINPISGSYIWGSSYLWSQDHLGGAPTLQYHTDGKLYLFMAANNGTDAYKIALLTLEMSDTIEKE